MRRNAPRIEMPVESEEKEFTSCFALFSPSRPPLNSIPDPSQLQKKATHLSGFELAQKFQGRGGGAHPRIVNRNARSRSEPNSSLVRELDEIQAGLGRYLKQTETMSTIGENKEEVCFSESKNCSGINDDTDNPDGNRIRIINESQDVLEENDGSMNNKSSMEREAVPRIEGHHDFELSGMVNNTDAVMEADEGADRSLLQFKLRKVIKDLEEAKTLNSQYEKEQKLPLSQQQVESIVCSFPQVKRKKPATKMTSRLLPFFFSVLLYTVTTLVSTASGATSCRTSCGSIQINYPFGIDKGCGSPQFNGMLNCSSSTDLFFFTPSGGYKVRSINYDKNTMLVFDPLMSTCSILQPHHDFKLSDIQNALIRPSYDTLFALFNCSSVSPVQNRYKSLCFNAAGHSCDELYSSCTSFRIFNTTSPYGNSTVHTTPYCCFTSYDTVRVMSMNILDCSHYTTVIDDGKMKGVVPIDWSYGIELSYSAPEIGCSPCQKSGGTCGYDDETEIFLCQCSNNISPRDCGGVSDQGGCNSTKANYPMLFLVMLVSFICAIL
ncbi:Uncharacterized protein Rs2_20636 [Raphanus sativus]|uniref:non-specific serine/threonine protein kinase n=1 Tax=Raphanus sativus TaxID=3726 RepID=A0A6J0P582_RAPSA|nr:uncharacterized protein LOC108862222 [Raphanus sativus]KAJ4893842.1 Uncharacterized protein Rs2_20636 [Raphanus sativus]